MAFPFLFVTVGQAGEMQPVVANGEGEDQAEQRQIALNGSIYELTTTGDANSPITKDVELSLAQAHII